MQTLPFSIEPDDDSQPAVGLVVLQSDETMEHELRQWLPDHYRLFHTRIPNSQEISEDSLHAMKQRLPDSVSLLPVHTSFRVVAYGCTSASTVIGEHAVTQAIHSVLPACAVTNPITAIKAQLAQLNAKRIALLTPYAPQVSQALYDLLVDSGYIIVRSGSFNESEDDQVARISPQSIRDAIEHLGAERNIDAIVASCTNLRTYSLLDDMTAITGCPVISSNSALAWHIQQLIDASDANG